MRATGTVIEVLDQPGLMLVRLDGGRVLKSRLTRKLADRAARFEVGSRVVVILPRDRVQVYAPAIYVTRPGVEIHGDDDEPAQEPS